MSQYNEESILNKFFGNKSDGVVVELGAAYHDINSNSKFLINKGWKALLVEPNRFFFNDLLKSYKDNPNIHLENCCAFTHDIEEVTFYEYGQLSTMSTSFKERVERIGEHKDSWMDHTGTMQIGFIENKVNVVKTSKLIEKYFDKVNFISVDCEGADFDVIKGLDLEKLKVDLICHERQNESHVNSDIEAYLNGFGYTKYTENIGNVFYNKN